MKSNFYDFSNFPVTGTVGTPTESDMSLIRKQAIDDVAPEEVFVFSVRASDQAYDSFHSRMDDTTLRNYAEDYLDGRSLLRNHEPTQIMGRSYNGEYKNGSTLASLYVVRGIKTSDIASDDYITGVRTGIFKDVSVRFHGGTQVCELCDNEVLSRACAHLPGKVYDIAGKERKATYGIYDARAAELSHVWKGSNSNAVSLKAAQLRALGKLDDKDIAQYNRLYGGNLRADMERVEIISVLTEDLKTDESYLLRAMKIYKEINLPYWERKDYSEEDREKAKKSGHTLPGTDSFPINSAKDVENAKHDVGRTKHDKGKVKAYINKMASEYGVSKIDEDK